MIFNSFDRALWLILKNDKKNRKRILEFIRTIPNQFIMDIQKSIDEYNKYKINNIGIDEDDVNKRTFSGEIYTKDGYFYSYQIDTYKDMLFIGRSIYENGAYYNDFRLSLSSVDSNVNNLSNQNIGGILSSSLFEERFSIDYSLFSSKIGILMLKFINNNNYRLCCILNRDIPDNYDLEEFENKFVRIKKIYKGERV